MKRMLRAAAVLLAFAAGGCAGTTSGPDKDKLPEFRLSCAAALPAAQAGAASRQPAETLIEGVSVLNQQLRDYFGGRTDIRLISAEEAGDAGGPRTSLAAAKAAAEKVGCNAILETSLSRYKERLGGEYTAKEPAAVGFSYRLLALPEGTVLCRGSFDEEQEPLMNNLLKFRQSAENGFKWVTAERLLEQSLRERLDACVFLNGTK
ncbi:hypothetical protein [Candidatus Electronema sp. TJ]|uniref:hypothetical protein n=1 Tax=Candidatus Electronema sp. TJ TaxID=3401573 RepID=UPI003AA86879